MAGRYRTPTAILKLTGAFRKDRHGDGGIDATGTPVAPDWLSDYAREEWGRVAPSLVALGIVGESDSTTLAGYCEAWASFRKAKELVDENGMTFTTEGGRIFANPAVAMMRGSLDLANKLAMQLGLTPSSRARMKNPMEAAGDPIDEFHAACEREANSE